MPSLYRACQQIVDGRKARGKRYDLAGVMIVLIWAKLAGMSSVLVVSQWAKDQEKIIRRSVGIGWKGMPCANTYSGCVACVPVSLQGMCFFIDTPVSLNEEHTCFIKRLVTLKFNGGLIVAISCLDPLLLAQEYRVMAQHKNAGIVGQRRVRRFL